MKVTVLSCPQCGGSLDRSADECLLSCQYCGARLRVERAPEGGWERQLKETQTEVVLLRLDNQMLQITNQIQRLDHAWEARRKELMIRGRDTEREPSVSLGVGVMAMGAVATVAGVCAITSCSPLGFITLAGVVAGIAGFSEYSGGKIFEEAQFRYQCKRGELTRRQDELVQQRNSVVAGVRAGQ